MEQALPLRKDRFKLFKRKKCLIQADNFIRIPLSGILIKLISLRTLCLCVEIDFGQGNLKFSLNILKQHSCGVRPGN
jgi:hypothetical protein